jgi:hypothetical protein
VPLIPDLKPPDACQQNVFSKMLTDPEDTRVRLGNLHPRRRPEVRLRGKGSVISAPAVVLAVLVLSCAGYVTLAQKQDEATAPKVTISETWQTFTGPDGDFTLSFPGKPSHAADAQGPVAMIRAYELTTQDVDFVVNFQDIGGDPKSREYNEWAVGTEETLAASMREQGQRIMRMRRIARNVIEVNAWQTVKETGTNHNYLARHVVRRGRTYLLTCASLIDGKEVDKSICRRFFSSLRFSR